jgi:DNA-binding MarR family transcriptional regulator
VKNPFDQLDKVLEHRVRLQIMSVLVSNQSYDFNSLKELLGVTDGNLASHIKALEREKYISINKSFVDRKPNTKYRITEKGRQAFKKHLDALEAVVRKQRL